MAKKLSAIFTARLLRYGLAVLLIALTAGMITSLFYAQTILQEKATETSRIKAEAEFAQGEVATLDKLRADLAESETAIAKAEAIVADSKSYRYQDQVIDDITSYADRYKISIEGFDFSADTTIPTGQEKSLASAKKTIVTVSIAGETNYDDFLRLVRSLEQNVTKLQLTGLTISPTAGNGNNIAQTSLEIEVYIQ